MNFISVSDKIKNSNPLDFSSIFSRSIELFKEVWVQGFMTLLFITIASIPFVLVLYIPMVGFAVLDAEFLNNDSPPILFLLAMLVLVPIMVVGLMMVSMALNAAFLRICRITDRKESDATDYFYFFKKQYRGKLFKLALISLGLVLLGYLACFIGVFYVIVPISLIPAFLAFEEELSAMEIVKASIALANKNWLVIFGLLLVGGLVAQLGMILCCVGILFTASLAKIPAYFIHKDAVSGATNLPAEEPDSTEDRLKKLMSSPNSKPDSE